MLSVERSVPVNEEITFNKSQDNTENSTRFFLIEHFYFTTKSVAKTRRTIRNMGKVVLSR